MKKTPVKNINEVLLKMQTMQTSDDEYEFYWNIVLEQYSRLIKKLIMSYSNKEDFYNDCVLKLPEVINAWIPAKGSFSNFLTWRLRGYIQVLRDNDSVIYFGHRTQKYWAKKRKKEEKTISFIPNDAVSKSDVKNKEYFPPTIPTIDSQLRYEALINIIKNVPDSDLWIDFHIKDVGIKELMDKRPNAYNKIRRADIKIKSLVKKVLNGTNVKDLFKEPKEKSVPNKYVTKLVTTEIAEEIRDKYIKNIYSMMRLSLEYNISPALVNDILTGRAQTTQDLK